VMIGRRQLIINLFSGHMKLESGLFRVSANFFFYGAHLPGRGHAMPP